MGVGTMGTMGAGLRPCGNLDDGTIVQFNSLNHRCPPAWK